MDTNQTQLTEIGKLLAAHNARLAEDKQLEIANTAQVNALILQNKAMLSVFRTLAPVFKSVTGGGNDIMALLPQLMPAINQLQNDKQLQADIQSILTWVNVDTNAGSTL